MKALQFLIYLAFSLSCHGFADWQTDAVPHTSGVVIGTSDFQGSHHSHATDDGVIHVAYVVREGELDTLYYLKKNLYANPGQVVALPNPVAIDTATRITSVQMPEC